MLGNPLQESQCGQPAVRYKSVVVSTEDLVIDCKSNWTQYLIDDSFVNLNLTLNIPVNDVGVLFGMSVLLTFQRPNLNLTVNGESAVVMPEGFDLNFDLTGYTFELVFSKDNNWIFIVMPNGINTHNELGGRDADNAHPISSIEGLEEAFTAVYESLSLKVSLAQLASESTGSGSDLVAFEDGKTVKDILKELIMSQNNPSITAQPGYPYTFFYPANDFQFKEMQKLAGAQSIGYGGSVWWVRPMAVGRQENGNNVVYVGTTYGSPENRELEQGDMDVTLWTNKRLGEAIIAVAKVTFENVNGTDYATFEKVGLNDRKVSYREDEHHQPMVISNITNGQIITSFGARNSARAQDGSLGDNKIVHIRYGQSIDSLSRSETPEATTTIDYSQGFHTGNNAFIFGRDDIGNWAFTTGVGGQNFGDFQQFLDSEGDQYYLGLSWVQPLEAGLDTNLPENRPVLHMFAQAHPVLNPDRTLRYLRGVQFNPGTTTGSRAGGGIFFTRPTTGEAPDGIGKLGDMPPLTRSQFETAYVCPEGRSYRLLDVQYGINPRALIVEFDFDWVSGASVPFGKTYDLKIVQYDLIAKVWTVTNVENNLRGALGYRPMFSAYDENVEPITPFTAGVEGFTALYVLGASFWRGKNFLDTLPIIYVCDRLGNDVTTHRLREITLSNDYTSVVSERVIRGNSHEILYRPEMTLNGNKRILWYNEGIGWSSFNSYVANHRWFDLTKSAALPIFGKFPTAISAPLNTNPTVGVEAYSPGGSKLTYQWFFRNSGVTEWSPASPTTATFTFGLTSVTNGRQYYCRTTNTVGSTDSAIITITAV